MSELTPDLLRRLLVAMRGDNCDGLVWTTKADGSLRFIVLCSDFFDYATADAEPIESEEDVVLLENTLDELSAGTSDQQPLYLGELYAARKRGRLPLGPYLNPENSHYMGDETVEVFRRLLGV